MVYIHNRILLSHKKEWNNAICGNPNGPRDCHTEWSKPNIIWYYLYVESKYDGNELIYQTETDLDLENKLMVTKGEGGRRDKLGNWDGHWHTAIFQMDNPNFKWYNQTVRPNWYL